MFWHRRAKSGAVQYRAFEMARNVSKIDRFFSLTLASGLSSFSELRDACEGFDISRKDEQAPRDLCDYLIEKHFLTEWQCDKLRSGKWKGFIDGDYRFRSMLQRHDKDHWTMVADQISTGDRLAIRVTHLKAPPWLEYTIATDIDASSIAD
jgi:hypothetical protein